MGDSVNDWVRDDLDGPHARWVRGAQRVHQLGVGDYVRADDRGWLPGSYATAAEAMAHSENRVVQDAMRAELAVALRNQLPETGRGGLLEVTLLTWQWREILAALDGDRALTKDRPDAR